MSPPTIQLLAGYRAGADIDGGSFSYVITVEPDTMIARVMLVGDSLIVFGVNAGSSAVTVADSLNRPNAKTVSIIVERSQGWLPLGTGLNGFVEDMVTGPDGLYAVGNFDRADNVVVHNVACWNGFGWLDVGGGVNGPAIVVATMGSQVFVGGIFSQAGGMPANNIARWDGQQWTPLGSGIHGRVNAMIIMGTDVFVGGDFDSAGGIPSRAVAHWDGNQWVEMSGGMRSIYPGKTPLVTTLATLNGRLVAGGIYADYTACGGPGFVSQRNDTGWTDFGRGTCGDAFGPGVTSLVSGPGGLVVGGVFSSMNGYYMPNVSNWNGTSWSRMGNGLWSHVNALAANEQFVYAGGVLFGQNNGGPYVARWNGTAWSFLEGAFTGTVYALTVHDHTLYVGGNFTRIGNVHAAHIASWRP